MDMIESMIRDKIVEWNAGLRYAKAVLVKHVDCYPFSVLT